MKNQSFLILPLIFYTLTLLQPLLIQCGSYPSMVTPGNWVILQDSIGISAMHMQLLKNDKVIMFDRTDFGQSNLSLPDGKCRYNDEAVKPQDCTAHSVLYDVASNTFRPLMILTNTWCSSGSVDSQGTLIQTGGDKRGERVIRTFTPCEDSSCDWVELTSPLFNRRWYASNQLLPDGRIIIVGGRRVFTYEFYPKTEVSLKPDNMTLPFLVETRDPKEENNLYPFLHLLPDGNLFIFANNRSILFDYKNHVVLKEFPPMPGGSRSYPSTGSSVLLPIQENANNATHRVEVLVCGGSPPGAHVKAAEENVYVEALRTCGRLRLDDPNATWVMEQMPSPRVMSDMLLLPTGDVIILNGAANGTAGWDDATTPVLNPVLYIPNEEPNRRFYILNPSNRPRMYHSTAVLLPDGRILVGGSNPHPTYNFTTTYPTELSLEGFYPHYLDPQYAHLRPSILTVETVETSVAYNDMFSVTFMLSVFELDAEGVSVVMIAPSFTTHSFGMGQRMLVVKVVSVSQLSAFAYKVNVIGPRSANVAPPGYYMLFLVHGGIPSHSVWIRVR